MKRDLMTKLVSWKESQHRKPLILNGARQVGKTWLLNKFGEEHFENIAYANFDSNLQLASIFDTGFDIPHIIMLLQAESHEQINPEKTLIIFDEIQECPKALTSLKYFCENAPQYAIAAAGSLLGITHHSGSGYPVGKVNTLDLYPMSFGEFLDAYGENMLRDVIKSADAASIDAFSSRLTQLLKTYYFVGGMPEAVSRFVESERLADAREVQNDILLGYERDISKHLSAREAEFTIAAWRSIPSHLGRENKKFVFGHIAKGARARDYRSAITWMTEAGIALKTARISKPGVPLSAYAHEKVFKLFAADIGLLGAMSQLDEGSVVNGNALFTEFKGALTEQYVCQELFSMGFTPYYWSAENSSGEIDFIVQNRGAIYPIEVKAEKNLRSRSLAAFNKAYNGMKCRRFSLTGFQDESWMCNVPLYAIGNFANWK